MRRSDFGYALPEALIAQAPPARREGARLLQVLADGVAHRRIGEFADLLGPDDLVVVNNTKVLNARLRGVKDSGGAVELLVERIEDDCTALCHSRSSKPLRAGRSVQVAGQRLAVLGRLGQFQRMRFPAPVQEFLSRFGETPLPPYIRRDAGAADQERYQTVFAEVPGASAAPTAGLHFSQALLERIRQRCGGVAEVTLHIGAGTFQPVRVQDLSTHQMHSERYEVSRAAAERIQACLAGPGRLIAVGTTVVRTLEAVALRHGRIRPCRGETELFIKPGFRFRAVEALLTNFHLPESTLLMLVCAFAGQERTMRAYQCAVRQRYRFFSYGDAMFTNRFADV